MKLTQFFIILILATLSELNAQKVELLNNPDFLEGTNGWWYAGATVTSANGIVNFDITSPGVNPWDVLFGQGNFTLKKDYKYTLSWRAKRESGDLAFILALGEEPYTPFIDDKREGFNGSWQESSVEYTHTESNISNIGVSVQMGGSDANAAFDYIHLTEEPIESSGGVVDYTSYFTDYNKFIGKLTNLTSSADSASALNDFWDALTDSGKFPFAMGNKVAFLYRGSANSVSWAGGFNQSNANADPGVRLGVSNVWILEKELPSNSRFGYKIVINGNNWVADPHNPYPLSEEWGNSDLRMPDYEIPVETIERPTIPKGKVSGNILKFSTNLNYTCQYKVYTPAGYNELSNLPVMFVTDGQDFSADSRGQLRIILDNLIYDKKIKPLIAVFLDPRDPNNLAHNRRSNEYRNNINFVKYVTRELIPDIDAGYKTNTSASAKAIAGYSYGGYNAAYFCANAADYIKNTAILSPIMHPNPPDGGYTIDGDILAADLSGTKIFMSYGIFDKREEMYCNHLRNIFAHKNKSFTGKAVNYGHSFYNWSEVIVDALKLFFPFTTTATYPPVIAGIPNQTFPEGSNSLKIQLDNFVTDENNSDNEISWSYSGNTELNVSIDESRVATITKPNANWSGSETITFKATDPQGNIASKVVTFTSAQGQKVQLLSNSDFTNGTDDWWHSGATVTSENGIVNFDISSGGTNPWDIQLGQGNLTLRKGYKYTLSWRAKRESGVMEFRVALGSEPYTTYLYSKGEGFDGNWQESRVEYIHNEADIPGMGVTLQLGGNDANAAIDYIRLTEEPLGAEDDKVNVTFQVDMKNQTVSGNGVYLNGSFSNWQTPVKMQPNGSIYSTELELVKGSTIEYKYLNGDSNESIAGNCTVGDYKNRVFTVPDSDYLIDAVCFNSCFSCVNPSVSSTNPGVGPVSYYGKMQVQGNRIIGERTQVPMQVKGISFFWSIWGGEKFWTPGAVNALVDDWKVELIRAAMSVEMDDAWGTTKGYLNPEGKQAQIKNVETLVEAAIERDIYVIIDFHSHEAHLHTKEAKEFFGYMANKYGNYDNVIFELYNEPIEPDWATVKNYAEAVIDTIRKHSDNLVIVGTENFSQRVDVASFSPIEDNNTAYVFHFYATHQEELRNIVRTALDNNIALFASEWGNIYVWGDKEGITDDQSFVNSDVWHKLLDDNMISSANWSVFAESKPNSLSSNLHSLSFSELSKTGEHWNDTTIMTESGKYVFNMLNEHAKQAPWRKAEHTNTVQVTFSVNLYDEEISDQGVFLEGSFNDWETQVEMIASNTEYTATIELPVGAYIEYRFKNGSVLEEGKNGDCYTWDNNRLLIVPETNIDMETYCFNSCEECVIIETFVVEAVASPTGGGVVSGAGTYEEGNEVTLTAAPNEGYELVNWTNDGVEVSADQTFTITISENTKLQANFQLIPTFVVDAASLPSNGGRVEGTGTFEEGVEVTLVAIPGDGYEFVNWTNNGVEVSADQIFTISVSESTNLQANFQLIPTFVVDAASLPSNAGIVEGTGTFEEGVEVTLVAIPGDGYEFVNWTNGGVEISSDSAIILSVSENLNLQANFRLITGIGEFDFFGKNIQVFPNPTTDNVSIKGFEFKSKISVCVYTTRGKLLMENSVINSTSKQINLKNLDAGVYWIVIRDNDFVKTFKLVKIPAN